MNNKEIDLVDQEKLTIEKSINTAATYSFLGEDHTLGNLLRSILMKDSSVAFAAYSVPHPSEEIMNVRLQTYSKNTNEVLLANLNNLANICDVMTAKFENAIKVHK